MAEEVRQVGIFVKRKISRLTESGNESAARASLAKLRRGIGRLPGSMPELWNETLEGMPESLMGRGNGPSRSEWAVHTALTLFALHQQGKDLKKQPMSSEGVRLGTAIRKLIQNEEDEPRIKRRFDAAVTADSLAEFAHHLRGLIQLMKAVDILLDYPSLARDLFSFQFPDYRDAVRLQWGRDFYRTQHTNENDNPKQD